MTTATDRSTLKPVNWRLEEYWSEYDQHSEAKLVEGGQRQREGGRCGKLTAVKIRCLQGTNPKQDHRQKERRIHDDRWGGTAQTKEVDLRRALRAV